MKTYFDGKSHPLVEITVSGVEWGGVALLSPKLLGNSQLLLDFPNQKIQIQSS
jgi:hypothetical protein